MKGFNLSLLRYGMKKKLTQEEQMLQNIHVALGALYEARSNFDMVVGADNIDLAILELSTAEKRYQNLIKEAKRLGITKLSPGNSPHAFAEKEPLWENPLEQS